MNWQTRQVNYWIS